MQPHTFEQHWDRIAELGMAKMAAAVFGEETDDEGVRTRRKKKVVGSDIVGKVYTLVVDVVIGERNNQTRFLYKGDEVEINKTEAGNGTGITYVLNHLPRNSRYRRVHTTFMKVDQIFPALLN